MSDLHVELSQIDRSDLNSIKHIINSGFNLFIDENSEFNHMDLVKWYDTVLSSNRHMFAIRVSKAGADVPSRSWLVGVCGLVDIDWISRHGKLIFLMVDKGGHKSTLQNYAASQYTFKTLLEYAFNEICLNKVWISVQNNNDISSALNENGFIADGIRRRSVFTKGKYRDESIFSLTINEFLERQR